MVLGEKHGTNYLPYTIVQIMYQKFGLGLLLARKGKDWYRIGLVLKKSSFIR